MDDFGRNPRLTQGDRVTDCHPHGGDRSLATRTTTRRNERVSIQLSRLNGDARPKPRLHRVGSGPPYFLDVVGTGDDPLREQKARRQVLVRHAGSRRDLREERPSRRKAPRGRQVRGQLDRDRAVFCLRLLLEGNSLRATARLTGVGRMTFTGILIEAGEQCRVFLDGLRNLPAGLADVVLPGLGAAGTISGEVLLTGTSARPDGSIQVTGAGLRITQGPGAGLPAAARAPVSEKVAL